MIKKNIFIISVLTIIIIIINTIIFDIMSQNKQEKIDLVLKDKLNKLQVHFDVLYKNQETTAKTVYQSTILTKNVINILSKAQNSSYKQKDKLRKELHDILKEKYKRLVQKGVLQFQFVLSDGISFLRVHKPNKFGDNIAKKRDDFKYTIDTHKPIRGFVQGKTAHGFRNVFPIFDKNKDFIGALEISFASEKIQDNLTNISKIHTHFLVNKHIFDSLIWDRDDFILDYKESAEHKDYMITMTKQHNVDVCITQNKRNLKNKREQINKNIKIGKKFAIYTIDKNNKVTIVSFFPIKDLKNTITEAWLVSYEKSDFIYLTLKSNLLIRVIVSFISIILAIFVFLQILAQQRIKIEYKLLNNILNSTDDMMLVTDFKSVKFSNKKFLNFTNSKSNEDFNEKTNNNLLSIFLDITGYLHTDLIKNNESFYDLITNTLDENRTVSILDKNNITKSFNINITKASYKDVDEYLVTLTDITKLKEKEMKIENKAYFDGLTGIFNRNKFDEICEQEFSRAYRYKHSFSLAIVDIDHFKLFNDNYGHLIGDEVLIMLAKEIQTKVRDTDTFARWGGEEFVILFPETSKENAKIICDKLRINISSLSHKDAGKTTASFGITEYKKDDTLETMFKRCDDALYYAKENGRDMVWSN